MLRLFLVTTVVSIIVISFLKWITSYNDYFKERNIKSLNPTFSFLFKLGLFTNRFTALDFSRILYTIFPNEPIYGSFDGRIPRYTVRDPRAIKHIAVKAFDHFEDHQNFTNAEADKLWGNSLLFMKGEKWRQMRATLSPAFTGSKMRQMIELINECATDVVKHFSQRSENGEGNHIEMKDLFSRYTIDVIATCAFGLKINSFAEPENEFYINGKEIMNFEGVKFLLKALVFRKFPAIARALKMSMLDHSASEYIEKLTLKTMEIRKKNAIFRPDVINIMMEVRDVPMKFQANDGGNCSDSVDESADGRIMVNRKWSEDEIIAQCFLFFLAGFHPASTFLTFVSYELTRNQDIQQKLYEEIVETKASLGGLQITYDSLQKMKYLDQVIRETLRKWPTFFRADRICVKDYIYDDGNQLKFKIEKGSVIYFPIYGIQNDEKYFPEPEKFDPERFSDENKDNIVSGTFIPFGVGPRNCIGSRFALMEIKAILYHLLLNFSFEPNEKTQLPIKLKKGTIHSPTPENGMHLELKTRGK